MISEQLLQMIYNISLGALLWATAIAIGLRITLGQFANSFLRTRLMFKALLLNLVIIPLSIWILTRILPVDQSVAIGLLLLAAAAGGPFGLTAAQLAGGDVAFALALIAVLQVTRIVAIPFWLGVFQPEGLSDVVQSIVSLVLYILLPLVAGMVLRRFLKERSVSWSRLAEGLGSGLIMIVIAAAILLYHEKMAELVFSWMLLLIPGIQLLSWGLGYALGGPETAGRRAVAVTAIVRSSAVALLIANQVYAEQPFVSATVVTYGVAAFGVATLAGVSMSRLPQLAEIRWRRKSADY